MQVIPDLLRMIDDCWFSSLACKSTCGARQVIAASSSKLSTICKIALTLHNGTANISISISAKILRLFFLNRYKILKY